ncbi:MAG: LysM peptidoglycan-binding domain-containing protein [bacterium]
MEVIKMKWASVLIFLLCFSAVGLAIEGPYHIGDTIYSEGPYFYEVQKDDCLWTISENATGRGIFYEVIVNLNPGQIQDPKRIYPGQIFRVPAGWAEALGLAVEEKQTIKSHDSVSQGFLPDGYEEEKASLAYVNWWEWVILGLIFFWLLAIIIFDGQKGAVRWSRAKEAGNNFLRFWGLTGDLVPAGVDQSTAARMLGLITEQTKVVRGWGLCTTQFINKDGGIINRTSLAFGQKEVVDDRYPNRRVRMGCGNPTTPLRGRDAEPVLNAIREIAETAGLVEITINAPGPMVLVESRIFCYPLMPATVGAKMARNHRTRRPGGRR